METSVTELGMGKVAFPSPPPHATRKWHVEAELQLVKKSEELTGALL
jgi:hypothetical protein